MRISITPQAGRAKSRCAGVVVAAGSATVGRRAGDTGHAVDVAGRVAGDVTGDDQAPVLAGGHVQDDGRSGIHAALAADALA
jgi:hypothetical protein